MPLCVNCIKCPVCSGQPRLLPPGSKTANKKLSKSSSQKYPNSFTQNTKDHLHFPGLETSPTCLRSLLSQELLHGGRSFYEEGVYRKMSGHRGKKFRSPKSSVMRPILIGRKTIRWPTNRPELASEIVVICKVRSCISIETSP